MFSIEGALLHGNYMLAKLFRNAIVAITNIKLMS